MTANLGAPDERAPNEAPVSVIAPQHVTVSTTAGSGTVPIFVSGEWNMRLSHVRRAVVLIHGRLRNADAYFALGHRARSLAGHDATDTLLIVPQFTATADLEAHALPESTLHWEWVSWMGGDNALGPAPLSSFDVIDAILGHVASPEWYPSLTDVVIAGHSGGAQVVQRYAVVTRGESPLVARGIRLRFVIANPSSYVYFDTLRPTASGGFAPFDDATCPGFNQWKYGLDGLPGYATAGGDAVSASTLREAYARRDVVVLLGTADCDPYHPALDRSCAALAQGEHRLARGRAYARYMAFRKPTGLQSRTLEVAGIGHDPAGIFSSAEGLDALFGSGSAMPDG
jgi:pimeloyl-ACP methyl ester carboxylesterase